MIYYAILPGSEFDDPYISWGIFVLFLTSRFANNPTRFAHLFICVANVRLSNNPSRFADVFRCFQRECQACSDDQNEKSGISIRSEDHSVLLLANILAHAFFFCSLQIIHANSSRIVIFLNICYFYRGVLFGDYEIFEWVVRGRFESVVSNRLQSLICARRFLAWSTNSTT